MGRSRVPYFSRKRFISGALMVYFAHVGAVRIPRPQSSTSIDAAPVGPSTSANVMRVHYNSLPQHPLPAARALFHTSGVIIASYPCHEARSNRTSPSSYRWSISVRHPSPAAAAAAALVTTGGSRRRRRRRRRQDRSGRVSARGGSTQPHAPPPPPCRR